MKLAFKSSAALSRTGVAVAVALAFFGPTYAADSQPPLGQYDSAVTYAEYRHQQGSYILRASELIGRDVHDARNDKTGEIEDLIVSRDGETVMAIISLGGLFGHGTKLVAIPYQDLRIARDGGRIYYSGTTEDMQGRSAFTYGEGEHPSQAQSGADTVDAADARTPHVASKEPLPGSPTEGSKAGPATAPAQARKPADNSANNSHDVARNALTPFDQSNTEADVGITRSIRQALIDDDTLGTNSQNVKVITVGGVVTLRGAVANTAEKTRIVAIAKDAAGEDRVRDEIQAIER